MKKRKRSSEKSKSKKVSIFTIIKHLTELKTDYESLTEEERSAINPYMLNRFLSMNPMYLGVVNYIQRYWAQLSKESVYRVYLALLPRKRQYLTYIKGVGSDKYHAKVVEILSSHLQSSKKEVVEYLDILSKRDDYMTLLFDVLQRSGVPETEIVKLCK